MELVNRLLSFTLLIAFTSACLKGELSLDSLGILAAASETQVPVVLQSSFNALGQKEYKDQIPYEGYLKVPNGSSDLINYGIKSAIYNKFIQNKKNINPEIWFQKYATRTVKLETIFEKIILAL